MNRLATAVIVLATITASGSNALAQERQVVRYGDLDLTSPSGARRMISRIDAAALRVCGGGQSSLGEVNRAVRHSGCWSDATFEALSQLEAPSVVEAWQATFGRRGKAAGSAADSAIPELPR